MSRFTKYGTRDGEDEEDPLLTSYHTKSPPPSSSASSSSQRFHPYTVVGVASALVVGIILIAAVSLNGHSSSTKAHKTTTQTTTTTTTDLSAGTSYRKGTKPTNFIALDEERQRELFSDYKKKFSRAYPTKEEEDLRFKNFQSFLKTIDERNAKEATGAGKAVHGITRFADMSHDEFKKGFLNYKRNDNPEVRKNLKESPIRGFSASKKDKAKAFAAATASSSVAPTVTDVNKGGDTPTSVDWTGVYTTSVKDQGYCGSCWAFSAVEQMESDSIRTKLLTAENTLSPQQIVSCDPYDLGCNGGDTVTAYAYAYSAGGVTTEAQYPYVSYWGKTGDCVLSSDTLLVKPVAYYQMVDEDAMEAFVLTTGPLSVCLDASEWASYTSGIVTSCGKSVDHCVQVVGIDTAAGYWKVRNSWGTTWGDRGFIYLATGSNICNIASEATYLSMVKV